MADAAFDRAGPIIFDRDRKLRSFTGADLDGRPIPERVWHARPFIPGRSVTVLSGDGGLGKSTLGLQLCCATALGESWLGLEVRQGQALFIGGEDDADELHRRLDMIAMARGLSLAALGGVRVASLADEDALLATGSPGQGLEPTPLWHELEELVEDWSPRVIVLDSLADVYGASEIDRCQVRQFVGLLRQLAIQHDAAVVLLAHPSLSGLHSRSGTSGSTAWSNSARSRLYLERPAADEGGAGADDIRMLSLKKANYAAANVELRLRYQAGIFFLDDDSTGPATTGGNAYRIDARFLELLDAFEAEGRVVSDQPGRNSAPDLFASDPRSGGIGRTRFRQAMGRLFAEGLIRVVTEGPPSRTRKRIVRCPA
jgi:RecA-family ATPase